jgi:hypothetical protein
MDSSEGQVVEVGKPMILLQQEHEVVEIIGGGEGIGAFEHKVACFSRRVGLHGNAPIR